MMFCKTKVDDGFHSFFCCGELERQSRTKEIGVLPPSHPNLNPRFTPHPYKSHWVTSGQSLALLTYLTRWVVVVMSLELLRMKGSEQSSRRRLLLLHRSRQDLPTSSRQDSQELLGQSSSIQCDRTFKEAPPWVRPGRLNQLLLQGKVGILK